MTTPNTPTPRACPCGTKTPELCFACNGPKIGTPTPRAVELIAESDLRKMIGAAIKAAKEERPSAGDGDAFIDAFVKLDPTITAIYAHVDAITAERDALRGELNMQLNDVGGAFDVAVDMAHDAIHHAIEEKGECDRIKSLVCDAIYKAKREWSDTPRALLSGPEVG